MSAFEAPAARARRSLKQTCSLSCARSCSSGSSTLERAQHDESCVCARAAPALSCSSRNHSHLQKQPVSSVCCVSLANKVCAVCCVCCRAHSASLCSILLTNSIGCWPQITRTSSTSSTSSNESTMSTHTHTFLAPTKRSQRLC